MESNREHGFVVYLRSDSSHATALEEMELPVGTCPSYEEALQFQRTHPSFRSCVIRYEGPTGGGD